MRLKEILKLVMPPVFIQLVKRLRSDIPLDVNGLSGDFRSWDEALTMSTGYNSDLILEKTRTALMKIKNGEAVYERDSVLFDEIEYAWPVLAGLMWVAARCGGRLNVLDFGGSLGSTYFQNRAFLAGLREVRWNIVEQPRQVEVGKALFEDDHLHFYADIAECVANTQPNIGLLSSVLQYLEYPYTVFDQITALPYEYVIINRTPFWTGATDRLCVQSVPPSIYPASYPSWIFSKERFRSHLTANWEIVAEFDNQDWIPGPVEFAYRGMMLHKRKAA